MARFASSGVVALLVLILAGPIRAAPPEPAHVLVLMSYHHGHSWEDDILRGFEAWDGAASGRPVLHVEWMDTKRNPGVEYRQRLQRFLEDKYAGDRFDLIVAVDDNALVMAAQTAAWREVPIVFSGINGDPLAIVGERGRATGIAERFAVKGTLRLALSLHSKTERLVFITANDESGAGNRRTIEADLASLAPDLRARFAVEHWTPPHLAEIESRLTQLSEHVVVFALGSIPDVEGGRPLANEQLVAHVRARARGPVYSDTDRSAGRGAVGGYVNSGIENGRLQARMARRILAGEAAQSLPVVFDTPQVLLIDYNELRRFGLTTRSLPQGAEVLNRPPTIFAPEHRTLLLGLIGFIGVLLLVMGALLLRGRLKMLRVQQERASVLQAANEALQQAKAAAETASHAKSAFLANMSHELRTPMNGVTGMITLAQRHMVDPQGRDKLDKALDSALRLLDLLNDILDLSKIEAERMVLEDEPFQPAMLLENLTSTLGHKAAEKGLRLSAALSPALARQPLRGDPLRLGQILLNLTGNAIKFTHRGDIEVRMLAAGETAEAVRVRFEVRDSGIGIAPEACERLFTAFEQADNSMTRRYGGTGLGLAICRRLVGLMGGEIGVDSQPGAGSTFWFEVPLMRQPASSPAPARANADADFQAQLRSRFAGARVLLAEDEPVNQEVARLLLEEVGLLVDLAVDGQQALQMAQRAPYALILMDMQMPAMNGLDASRAIRAGSLNRNTPILAITANAFDEDRLLCLQAGMNDHITKPIDPRRLYATLFDWLEEHAA